MTKDEALKLALEALEYMNVTAEHYVDNRIPEEAITAIKEVMAQPEQDWSMLEVMQGSLREHMARIKELEARLALPEQEPVAWKDMAFARLGVVRDKMHPADVETIQRFLDGDYTTPRQRTWVGLRWSDVPDQWCGDAAFMEGGKWAEKALKEKNT